MSQSSPFPDKDTRYVAILKPGHTPPISDEARAQLQHAHEQHIQRMYASGKLAVAGPCHAENVRGLYVFKTATLEEAQALTQADPAVQSGRLIFEMVTWFVPPNTIG